MIGKRSRSCDPWRPPNMAADEHNKSILTCLICSCTTWKGKAVNQKHFSSTHCTKQYFKALSTSIVKAIYTKKYIYLQKNPNKNKPKDNPQRMILPWFCVLYILKRFNLQNRFKTLQRRAFFLVQFLTATDYQWCESFSSDILVWVEGKNPKKAQGNTEVGLICESQHGGVVVGCKVSGHNARTKQKTPNTSWPKTQWSGFGNPAAPKPSKIKLN